MAVIVGCAKDVKQTVIVVSRFTVKEADKIVGIGVLDGPYEKDSEPRGAYYVVICFRHYAHVMMNFR